MYINSILNMIYVILYICVHSQVSTGLQVLPRSTCADFALDSGWPEEPPVSRRKLAKKDVPCGWLKNKHVGSFKRVLSYALY